MLNVVGKHYNLDMKMDVDKIANLANLEVNNTEKKELENQLGGILEFVAAIKNAPVDNVKVEDNLTPSNLRNDEPRDFSDKDKLKKDYQSPAVFS